MPIFRGFKTSEIGVKLYSEELLLCEINEIRKEIGHESVDIQIYDIIYNEKTKELWIITEDRPDQGSYYWKRRMGSWKAKRKAKSKFHPC